MSDILSVLFRWGFPVGLEIWAIYWLYGTIRGSILPYLSGTPMIRPVDDPAPDDNENLPAFYESTSDMLSSLGFSLLGKEYYQSVGGSTKACEWVYVSEDREVYAQVVYDNPVPVFLGFFTCFEDESMIMTGYPIGENIVTTDLISRFARHSPEAAFSHHIQIVEQWKTEKSRIPQLVNSYKDAQEFDVVWRLHHRKHQHKRLFRINVIMSLVALLFITANGLFILFAAIDNPQGASHASNIGILAIFLWIAVGLIANNRLIKHPPNPVDPETLETEHP